MQVTGLPRVRLRRAAAICKSNPALPQRQDGGRLHYRHSHKGSHPSWEAVLSNHERFVRRLREKLVRAHNDFVIGVVDWSMNEHKQGQCPSYWCPHVHGVTRTTDLKAL